MPENDELRPEYTREDLGEVVRRKYHDEYKKGTNVVLLDPDVAEAFPDATSVNDALRALKDLAERTAGRIRRSAGRRP